MLIDTHAHLNDSKYDENREELISNFRKQGIIFDAIPVFVNTPIDICKKRILE